MIADRSIFVSTHAHTQQQRDAKHAVMHHRSGLLTHFFCFTARNGETRISCFACMCRNCVIYACTCVCVCSMVCACTKGRGTEDNQSSAQRSCPLSIHTNHGFAGDDGGD